MYRINQQTNSIQKIEETTFKEIGASERNHLQEWIAKNPEVLCGEDESLLIIQKEFDGFNDTRERLDLLALDNHGNLVIIENKLDDSGRDVTWQGLKYVSYCASLTTEQILSIYDQFLGANESAEENVREFLGIDDGAELLLNDGDQRLVLIAHKFRKEVTSTVMWLLDKDIQIQCFKAVPFKYGNEALLQLEQIIPLPETQEYVISLQQKEKQEKAVSKRYSKGMHLMKDFWQTVKDELLERDFQLYESISAGEYFSLSKTEGWGKFAMCFGQKGFRVELYFNRDADKIWFDSMYQFKEELENTYPKTLVWQRLDDKKSSRLKHEMNYKVFKQQFQEMQGRPLGKWSEHEDWDVQREWFCDNIIEFYNHVSPFWKKAQNQIK
tara:strand:- start:506 stop:1654 length:1149 start_codon:yes stop_codon:yes gene_type:complete